jgi:hypothetical protein
MRQVLKLVAQLLLAMKTLSLQRLRVLVQWRKVIISSDSMPQILYNLRTIALMKHMELVQWRPAWVPSRILELLSLLVIELRRVYPEL